MKDLTLVLPAYNEEGALPEILPELLKFSDEKGCQLVIVNDGSKDRTREILDGFVKHPALTVVHHKVNRGYGGALKSGIRSAKTTYVMTIDADGQHKLQDVEKLYHLIREKDADMIVGSRPDKGQHWYRSLGKFLIRNFARLLLPLTIRDINSGMKVYDTELAQKYINLCPDHMAFSDIITLVFLSHRHLVLEEPIEINPRASGVSTINTMTAIDTVREIVNIVILFNPMRIFIPVATFLLGFGIIWVAPFMIRGEGVSTGGMLLIVSGLLFFSLGLLAEQLSTIRKSLIPR